LHVLHHLSHASDFNHSIKDTIFRWYRHPAPPTHVTKRVGIAKLQLQQKRDMNSSYKSALLFLSGG
jgi:hypothetical protein